MLAETCAGRHQAVLQAHAQLAGTGIDLVARAMCVHTPGHCTQHLCVLRGVCLCLLQQFLPGLKPPPQPLKLLLGEAPITITICCCQLQGLHCQLWGCCCVEFRQGSSCQCQQQLPPIKVAAVCRVKRCQSARYVCGLDVLPCCRQHTCRVDLGQTCNAYTQHRDYVLVLPADKALQSRSTRVSVAYGAWGSVLIR